MSDEVMGAGSAQRGLQPDEFREMLTEMAWNPGHAVRGR